MQMQPPTPPALTLAQQPLGGFSSNLVVVYSSLGKNSEDCIMTFQQIRKVT